MKKIPRPSPAMAVAIVALIAALGSNAIGGGILNKKKVNRIITNRAPGLSVATAKSADNAKNADNATTAKNAQQLGGVDPIVPATPMTLLNGWVRYAGGGYDTPAYWQDAFGVVHLKGSVAQPAPGSDVIFVLPEGLRPSQSMNWPATLDQAHFGTIEIETNGDVRSRTFTAAQAAQSRAFTSMEGVSFRPIDP